LIFNGALSYYPNYNAMDFFLGEIFPKVLAKSPAARLYITGSTQGINLDALPDCSQVTFTGYLDDIRPAVTSSQVCVVPLQQGAGTRLKILEAMALGTLVVSTSKGAEGLAVESGKHLFINDSPEPFAAHTLNLMNNPDLRAALSSNALRLLHEKYDWRAIGSKFCELVDQTYHQVKAKGSNVR
jgi:glycosyltransferase involved in cell wall biosynthesis